MNNQSHHSQQSQHSLGTYNKADRFARLTEKVSLIQTEPTGTSKYLQIDNKINAVDNRLQEHLEVLDRKYNALKEQVSRMTKIFDEEKFNREDSKGRQSEEIRNFEGKIRNMLLDERHVRERNLKNIFNKFLTKLLGHAKLYG